jgi:hypothetical protein
MAVVASGKDAGDLYKMWREKYNRNRLTRQAGLDKDLGRFSQ